MTNNRRRKHELVEGWLNTEFNVRHFTREELLHNLHELVEWGAMSELEYRIAQYELKKVETA